MSRSNDPGHFFQTDSSISETARKAGKAKNNKGHPVKLASKVLAVAADPSDGGSIYVAEAAGTVKRITPEGKRVVATYTGPTAPLTSIAASHTSDTLFAGCWDKSVWSWDVKSRKPGRRFSGHADFVKAVLMVTVQGRELLLSGSQDATIIVWDAATGEKLHTLKGHTRGVLALALDPLEYDPQKEEAVVFSAGSDREIRRWRVSVAAAKEVLDEPCPILAHETSVDAIHFDSDGDLWTASADKSAKCLSRARNWEEDTSFEHPDYARDVVVDEEGGWVVTACRDEEVRVWEKGNGNLHHVFEGHFEEVTALVLLGGQKVVSVSIDGTVRMWSLKAPDLAQAIKEAEDEREGTVEEKVEEKKEGVLTAEEEAELAALMEDSE
ncbi:WD domain-containing protein [Bimuria novae-zelandiae CBS 107.79]|uniref:WD domain-containing protein n=1 Tax=Bimuria novae-zelandiae CBS 107.79 TaxID=1447943 RepID=A0A6A5USJ4_9PLEO|nr:WD domain-containing protein [Bimuria novae-zelandiae CBS 107.79]